MANKNWHALSFQKIGHVFYAHGINYYNVDLKTTSLHAEADAIDKLKYNHKKREKKVNILVIRTNNKGDRFMLAKSCDDCMNYMRKGLIKKHYKLHRAWYSNDEGGFTEFKI